MRFLSTYCKLQLDIFIHNQSYKMSNYSYGSDLQNMPNELPKKDYVNNVVMSHNDLSKSSEDIKRAQQIVGPDSHVRIKRVNASMII